MTRRPDPWRAGVVELVLVTMAALVVIGFFR